MHVLIVDAARPLAQDGLAARAAALGSVNVPARGVVSGADGSTVEAVRAAVDADPPSAVLVGRVREEDAEALATILRGREASVVVDAAVAPERLVPAADVTVADAEVAARLGASALDGERPVVRVLQDLLELGADAAALLAGDGRHDGFKNDTGLRLSGASGSPPTETSALLAGLLALGYEPVEAWNEARLAARRFTDRLSASARLPARLRGLMAEHAHATFVLEEVLHPSLLPPEGGNLALAAADADGPDRVVDLRGRLVAAGEHVRMGGTRRLGGESRAVRALLAARSTERGVRACVTLGTGWSASELSDAADLNIIATPAREDPLDAVAAALADDLPDAALTPEGRLFLFASGPAQVLNRCRALTEGVERLRTG